MALIETAVFEPAPGDRIRILLQYEGTWRAMFWIKVAKDGSIYMAPRIVDPKTIKKGATISENGCIQIDYSDGVEVNDSNNLNKNKSKISFHASGVINTLDERKARKSLRDISEQELLCAVFFMHPKYFDVITEDKIGKRDICLRIPIEEEYPIFMHVFVSQKSKMQCVDMRTEKHQINIMLPYANLINIPDMVVQLAITTPAKGPWPPYTYIVFEVQE